MRLARIPPLALAAVAGLLLTACGAGPEASGAVEIRAAEDVFAEPPTVVPDPSGTSATLAVTTEVEMACAVVFGRDGEVGEGIATDTDMGGGAHTQHRAVMTGLQPDTEYTYRVQGSGPDGQLYRSEPKTFRTPPAEDAAAEGDGVALEATVADVSSEFSSSFAAANAVDGNPATEWSSAGDGDDAWITLDLGAETDVGGVGFGSRAMSDGTAVIESFTVTVDDGRVLGPFPAGSGPAVHEVDVRSRKLRFDAVETTGGNTGATEIEVYADGGA